MCEASSRGMCGQPSWRHSAQQTRDHGEMPRACGVSSYHARPSSADTQSHLLRGAHSARLRLCRHTLLIVRFRSDHGGENHRSLGFGDMESDAEYTANPRTGGGKRGWAPNQRPYTFWFPEHTTRDT